MRLNSFSLRAMWEPRRPALAECARDLAALLSALRPLPALDRFDAEADDGTSFPCASADDCALLLERGTHDFEIGNPSRAGTGRHGRLDNGRPEHENVVLEATLGIAIDAPPCWIPDRIEMFLEARWSKRFNEDPALLARYHELYARYRAQFERDR